MNKQEHAQFKKYIEPGRTIVRYVSEDKAFISDGIVMEDFPHFETDRVTCGYSVPEMIRVTWFDGGTDTFPLSLLDFWVEDQWLDFDDLIMGDFDDA